ncbi:hypothetical protein CGCF413_v011514 [Colletotrichum fructicola]|nr:hypothetical protein CGCF413_v011514 [Colletotrichum fructicola]
MGPVQRRLVVRYPYIISSNADRERAERARSDANANANANANAQRVRSNTPPPLLFSPKARWEKMGAHFKCNVGLALVLLPDCIPPTPSFWTKTLEFLLKTPE